MRSYFFSKSKFADVKHNDDVYVIALCSTLSIYNELFAIVLRDDTATFPCRYELKIVKSDKKKPNQTKHLHRDRYVNYGKFNAIKQTERQMLTKYSKKCMSIKCKTRNMDVNQI